MLNQHNDPDHDGSPFELLAQHSTRAVLMNHNSSTKAKARAKPRQNPNLRVVDPPSFAMQPTNHRRMRFISTSDGDLNVVIFSVDILAALGAMSMGGTDARTICSSFRIKRIDIWGSPKSDSDGAWQSAVVEWKNSTSFSKSSKVQDASNSNARPLHISTKPPPLSVCDLWVHGPLVELFHMKVPTGAIIDITVDYLLCDRGEPLLISLPSSATTGELQYCRLDFSSSNQITQIDR